MLHLTPEKLNNNKLQGRCPVALWHIVYCSLCRGHVVHVEADLSEQMRMYKFTLHSYKLASGTAFLVGIFRVNAFNGPALTSLTAIKMNNSRVKLLQRWSMSNGQHGNATLHACAIQLHLPVCTHLQKCNQMLSGRFARAADVVSSLKRKHMPSIDDALLQILSELQMCGCLVLWIVAPPHKTSEVKHSPNTHSQAATRQDGNQFNKSGCSPQKYTHLGWHR